MIDLNSIFAAALSSAVQQAVEAATKPLLERIAALEAQPASCLTRDEVREIADEAASDAVNGHCSDYEHDDFVSDLSSIDWSDYIDVKEQVREAVGNLTFEVSVS